LEKLYRMTNSQPHELYINLQNFDYKINKITIYIVCLN